MKKLLVIVASSLLLLASGCSDAYAKISNSNEAIFTVGNITVNKGQVYNFMKSSDPSSVVLDKAMDSILEVEVPLTDEITNEAKTQLDEMVTTYGGEDMFLYYMQMYGYSYTSIEEFQDVITQSTRMTSLVEKYIDENWDTLVTTYNPRKAIVMAFTSADDASAALIELNNGTDPVEVATAYNSTSTGSEEVVTSQSAYTAEVMTVINGATEPNTDYSQIASTDGNFYCIKVVAIDPNNFKDEVKASLESVSQLTTDCYAFYLNKYNFRIYDKDIYDVFQATYPNYIFN